MMTSQGMGMEHNLLNGFAFWWNIARGLGLLIGTTLGILPHNNFHSDPSSQVIQ